jgi:hypothetical protein
MIVILSRGVPMKKPLVHDISRGPIKNISDIPYGLSLMDL